MKNNKEIKKVCQRLRSEDKPGTLHGPYTKYSAPYGKVVAKVVASLNMKQWYVNTSTGTYEIVQFEAQPHRFILPQSHPAIERRTLKDLVKYLVGLEKRLVLCS
jgi:hypothetical protein